MAITYWKLLMVLMQLALQIVGQELQCRDHELCVSEKLCWETDDAGAGIAEPRMSRTSRFTRICGKDKVCCEKAQLESWNGPVRQDKPMETRGPQTSIQTIVQTGSKSSVPPSVEPSPYVSCGLNKECVPRQLCNGTINDNGRFLVIPRISEVCRPLQICCPLDDKVPDNPFLPQLESFQYKGCGYSNPNGVIIDLKDYDPDVSLFGEFPWMVALFSGRNQYLCGGTLIHPSLVLTTAHNVENHTIDTLVARSGDWDLSSMDEPLEHQSRRIKQIIMHEDFAPEVFYNDIALLVLAEPFKLAQHIQPLCLPPPDTDASIYAKLRAAQCYATGWGGRKITDEQPEHLLKRIELPVVAHAECQAKLRLTRLWHRFRLRQSFICAGGELGKDTCKGDGGSPLFCSIAGAPNRYVLAGLVSWGIECSKEDIPAVYANVPHLRTWIDSKVNALGFKLDAP